MLHALVAVFTLSSLSIIIIHKNLYVDTYYNVEYIIAIIIHIKGVHYAHYTNDP